MVLPNLSWILPLLFCYKFFDARILEGVTTPSALSHAHKPLSLSLPIFKIVGSFQQESHPTFVFNYRH